MNCGNCDEFLGRTCVPKPKKTKLANRKIVLVCSMNTGDSDNTKIFSVQTTKVMTDAL